MGIFGVFDLFDQKPPKTPAVTIFWGVFWGWGVNFLRFLTYGSSNFIFWRIFLLFSSNFLEGGVWGFENLLKRGFQFLREFWVFWGNLELFRDQFFRGRCKNSIFII